MRQTNYYQTARDNETVFRNVLRDLKNPSGKPNLVALCVPKELDAESSLDEIFKKYSEGRRSGIFTILDFQMPDKHTAIIGFEDVAFLSGGGGKLEYTVKADGSVEFKDCLDAYMS